LKSAPITALYAGLFALWFLFLSARVVLYRRHARIGIGSGGDKEMSRRMRVHGNAAEYLPLALLLMLLLELNTALIWPLHVAGVVLIAARALHAWGLGHSAGKSPGRFLGTALTWTVIAGLALANVGYGLALLG